jgi:plasmid stability protein
MSTLIQIRNVPEELHRRAKSRAALEGVTLSDYALRALERELREPTLAEIAARIRTLEPVEAEPSAAAVVREERDSR